jgi:sigma-B regulation protein RsbU (phosphoserine phosphatase)
MPRAPRLVLIEPAGSRREVEVSTTPFKMGRQAENDLTLRDSRISRQHAQIVIENGKYFLEDLGSRHGTFVNGKQVTRHELRAQDAIEFGVPDSFRLVYGGEESTLGDLLERVENPAPATSSSRELYHLGVLLEVARALHGSLSLEDVLTSVVDAAIQVTHTERGVLLLRSKDGQLEVSVARDAGRGTLHSGDVEISSSVLKQVCNSRRELIVGDVEGDADVRQQASVVRLALHTVVAIPLERRPMVQSLDSTVFAQQPELLGVLYLDSHAPSTAFSELDRQVLRSLAAEAATVVEYARLFAASRAQERLQHELEIASEIQQRMLPKTFPKGRYADVTGRNIACQSVGGDCYDVFELPDDRYGFVVGDVAGKGISASLLASVLQGVFAATAALGAPLKEVTTRVNRFLCERSGDERFATLFYCVLSPDGALEYVNAGHVTPLIRRPSGELVALASENFPLGMFDFAEYQTGNAKLGPGDFLVIYTDGISEASNPRGDLFEESRLRTVVQKFSGHTVEELLEAIQAEVRAFTENAPQADDITLVIVQYRGQTS